MGLADTRRILKLIIKPKPSFEITPSPPDQLFKVPRDRPGILWTTSPSSPTRKSQPHVQETSFTFSSLNIGDEQDFRCDVLADHSSPLSSHIRSTVYSQMCLKSIQDNAIPDTSPTRTPRRRLRRARKRFSSKSPDRDFCVLKTTQASNNKRFSGNIPFKLPSQPQKTFLSPDQPEITFKHSNTDLSPITEGRETFASPDSLSTMFDSPIGPLAASASSSTGKVSRASTINVPFETAHYLTSPEPSFFSAQQGIYPARSSPKLADYSTSTAQSSPVSPLVFADMYSFPEPLNCDVSHDLDLPDFPAHKGNTIITFDSCAPRSNMSVVVTEKAAERLELDALDGQISNKDPARTANSPVRTSAISTANSIKAPVVDPPTPSMSHDSSRPGAPDLSPLERIWSRLRHAVKKTLWKKSDMAGVENSAGRNQGSRVTRRMSAPLLTAGASSVRSQHVTRPRRLSKPPRPASASAVPDSKCGVSLPQKRLSKCSRPSDRSDINFATIFSPSFVPPP